MWSAAELAARSAVEPTQPGSYSERPKCWEKQGVNGASRARHFSMVSSTCRVRPGLTGSNYGRLTRRSSSLTSAAAAGSPGPLSSAMWGGGSIQHPNAHPPPPPPLSTHQGLRHTTYHCLQLRPGSLELSTPHRSQETISISGDAKSYARIDGCRYMF